MANERICHNPLCSEEALPSSRFCAPKCQRNLASRKHRGRKKRVLNEMRLGKEKFKARRASFRRLLIMTRINQEPLTKEYVDLGIAFDLEWTLGITTAEQNEPSDGLYVEWMLNSGNYKDDREILVKEALQSGIKIPEKEER